LQAAVQVLETLWFLVHHKQEQEVTVAVAVQTLVEAVQVVSLQQVRVAVALDIMEMVALLEDLDYVLLDIQEVR
jgi:hypothetical protein